MFTAIAAGSNFQYHELMCLHKTLMEDFINRADKHILFTFRPLQTATKMKVMPLFTD